MLTDWPQWLIVWFFATKIASAVVAAKSNAKDIGAGVCVFCLCVRLVYVGACFAVIVRAGAFRAWGW